MPSEEDDKTDSFLVSGEEAKQIKKLLNIEGFFLNILIESNFAISWVELRLLLYCTVKCVQNQAEYSEKM